MSVVIEAFDVVFFVESIERKYPGGLAAFRDAAPNNTFCNDGTICKLSFMHEPDRGRFVVALDEIGLKHNDGMALVRADEPFENDRIRCGLYASVWAAWPIGTSQAPLVVPLNYRPHSIFFHLPEDADLEYLGRQNGVETYRDRRTGQKLYKGRTEPQLDRRTLERLEKRHREGTELLQPFVVVDPSFIPGFFQKRRIRKGIDILEEVLRALPSHPPALFLIGMALRVLREQDRALEYLRRAYLAFPTNPDIGREYAAQLMILGVGREAVQVSVELTKRHPKDPGLHSNLALAHLIHGNVKEALRIAMEAHERDPEDPITKNLVNYTREVLAGRLERPTRMPGW